MTTFPFQSDKIQNYITSLNFLSKEECDKVIKTTNNQNLEKAKVVTEKDSSRESYVNWIVLNKETSWLYNRISDAVLAANKEFFNFNLYGIIESLQFTKYKAPSGRYGKHIDKLLNGVIRKLSISIQLTDPSEYEGGELNLYLDDDPITMDKQQGTIIIFPSFILHEVMPVTKGERNSLVTWITGDPFK
jgi:PKHD-type hydroxylase